MPFMQRCLLGCTTACCCYGLTARLWSLETFSNLVVYKGHTYPVWDCDFSPFSFYFATASHDRTARLWSSEHITPLRIFAGHMSDVDVCPAACLLRFHTTPVNSALTRPMPCLRVTAPCSPANSTRTHTIWRLARRIAPVRVATREGVTGASTVLMTGRRAQHQR